MPCPCPIPGRGTCCSHAEDPKVPPGTYAYPNMTKIPRSRRMNVMSQYIKANMPAPAAGDLADYTVQTPQCALDETTVPPAGKEGTTTGVVRYEGRVAALASVLAFGWADAALIGCIGCRPVCHSSQFLSLSLFLPPTPSSRCCGAELAFVLSACPI